MSSRLLLALVVLAVLPRGHDAAAFLMPRGPEEPLFPLMERLPPALVIEPEGVDGEQAASRRIVIPLPCTSIKCRSIIYKLAKMGKIPWEYYTQTLLNASVEPEFFDSK